MFKQLPLLAGHLELRMSHHATKAKVAPALLVELSKFTGHILNCALAECAPVRYAYCLTPQDKAVMDSVVLLEFIKDGQNFAFQEIGKLLIAAPPPEDEGGERPTGPESI